MSTTALIALIVQGIQASLEVYKGLKETAKQNAEMTLEEEKAYDDKLDTMFASAAWLPSTTPSIVNPVIPTPGTNP